MALALLVAACSPEIAAWRSLQGLNADDPNPKTAPFTGNLAKAYDQPYPNLASVPPPPTEETSTAERQKLAQTLITERTATAALGPPPPAAVPAKTPAAKTAAAAAPTKPAAAPRAGRAKSQRPGKAPAPQPQPLNSALRMPTIPGPLPQPQAPQPPPAVPVLAAVPAVPAAPIAPPAAVAAAMPPPAPAPPALPAMAALSAPVRAPPKRPPATTVATLDLASVSPAARATDKAQIAHVATLYKQQPRGVRVVAFAAAPSPGGDPLKVYNAALDRAQQVATALVAAGIPAGRIQTEANPASGRQTGRVEIQFAP
ncbi:MAG TPA: hypothetical protein VMF86_10900 [Stellaceae bacterium]|nr:hypothetical protein [Stellaceae bacterium]